MKSGEKKRLQKSTKIIERSKQYSKNTYLKNEVLAFLRATQSSIARDFERELKAASRDTLGSMKRFNLVCEEVEQWQACTNGLFPLLRSDRSFLNGFWNAGPGRAVGVEVSRKCFRQIKYSSKFKKKKYE